MSSLNGMVVSPGTSAAKAALSILYLGTDRGTSGHRACALERLGHKVTVVDKRNLLPNSRLISFWNFHSGCALLEQMLRRRILERIPEGAFDLAFVDAGEFAGPSLLGDLKARCGRAVVYIVDDPYGTQDRLRFRLFRKSAPYYDLVVVVRECNLPEATAGGAKDVLQVWRSADELAHCQTILTAKDREKWSSEVLFIGTWMPERGPLLARLATLGVPLTIYGDRWSRAKEWRLLQKYWRGPGIYNDEEYAKAIQCSKVCLGLLSKGNRDLSTQRSFEIPYLEGVLCAERTVEHEALYREDEEAVFWSTPEECAQKCARLLDDPEWRLRIGKQARLRCVQNETTERAKSSNEYWNELRQV
jgi:spore maturation protein CgeB